MRKAKTPNLPKQAGWYAALAAAGNVVYPQADPLSGRPVGRVSTIDYQAVYDRVVLGTPQSPGLLSPEFLRPRNFNEPPPFDPSLPRSLGDANLVEIEGSINDWLQSYIDRNREIYAARDLANKDFTEAIAKAAPQAARGLMDAAFAVMRDELGIPIPRRGDARRLWDSTVGRVAQTRRDTGPEREFLPPMSVELRRQREAFEGLEPEQRQTPQQMLETEQRQRALRESTSGFPAQQGPPAGWHASRQEPASMESRVLALVDSLERNVAAQTFTRVPLGFQESDFALAPNPARERLEQALKAANDLANASPVGSAQRTSAEAEVQRLEAQLPTTPERVLQFAPGRAPMTPAQRRAADFFTRVRATPSQFTVGQVNLMAMITRQRPEGGPTRPDGGMLYEDDVAPIVRSFYQRGDLAALKQRLIDTDFITNPDRIRDMNAPDDETVAALADVIKVAQRSGVTWEQELERLENDQDYMDRVAARRRGAGGGATITYRLPSDDDLTAVFKAVSRSTIGRELPKEAYQSMVESYKPMLLNYQRQLQGGGVVTEPPQAETFAATQISEQYRGEEFTYGLGQQLNNFMQILGGGM